MSCLPAIYLCLLHTQVLNRQGLEIVTSITNLDVSDIARSARTYALRGYYLVTPIPEQHALMNRVLDHWRTERARSYHPDRVEALSLVRLVSDFTTLKEELRALHGHYPEVFLTDARAAPQTKSYAEVRRRWAETRADAPPVVLVFGTGWGVAPSFYSEIHHRIQPVWGPGGESAYNHLSVRAAVAVILDRLLGC